MLPALAEIAEMETRLGKAIPTNQVARAQSALLDASTLVRSEVGQTWVDAERQLTDIPDVARMVTLAVALRAYQGESIPGVPGLGERMVRSPNERPVYLTSAEKRALASLAGNSGVFTLSTTRGGDPFDTVFVPAAPDSDGWVPFIAAADDVP